MSTKVYILLDVKDGKAEQVTQVLRESPGVAMADVLEGPPDVIMIIEAEERQKLAKLTIQAIGSVETTTENVCLLPVKNGLNTSNPGASFINHKLRIRQEIKKEREKHAGRKEDCHPS